MPVIGPSVPVLTYYPDSPPSIMGKLGPGATVTIELWKNDVPVVLQPGDNACEEVGDTGIYAWSTAKLPAMQATCEQYTYRMKDQSGTKDEGEFILESDHVDAMPSLNDRASYIMDPRA